MYKYFLFIFSFFFCIKALTKLDPPYVILQYLQNINSASGQGQEDQGNNSNSSQCSAPSGPFNPGAIFDTGQTLCWDGGGFAQDCALVLPGSDGSFNNVPNARNFVGPTQHCKLLYLILYMDLLGRLVYKDRLVQAVLVAWQFQ